MWTEHLNRLGRSVTVGKMSSELQKSISIAGEEAEKNSLSKDQSHCPRGGLGGGLGLLLLTSPQFTVTSSQH